MPSHVPQQTGARFTSHVLTIPKSGMRQVTLTAGQQLEFSFDPSGTTFSRSGTDLIISGNDGAGVTLSGFFVAENADALPQFILPGGDSVPASSYLQSLNIDVTTAAGPAPSAPPSGGEGEYADGAGDLIGGLDRLGSLGSTHWDGATKSVPSHMDSAPRLDNVAGGGGSDGGNPEIIAFNARAVLYMQHEGDAPGAQPYDTRSVTVQALVDNNGTWEASGQNANTIVAHPANPLDVNALLVWEEDGNGNVTFRLSAAGKAWMAAHPGQDIAAYYVISDANGKSYTLQVVISADGGFDSSSEHNGYLDRDGLIHGEWHDGKDLSQETGYKTTSSNLSDDLRYTGKLTGAEINTGYAADKNWGDDSVTIEGSVQRSSITSGAGNDSIVITGSSEYDRSIGGEWPTGMSAAAGPRSREEAGGATVWGGNIDAGDGNNTIRISGGAMYGIMETAITTGSGDDLIEIRGGSTHDRMDVNGRDRYFGGNAVKDSVIDAGDGNNTITITSDYPFNPNVTGNDTIGGHSMATVNNSKVITGKGDDSITINAAVFEYNSPHEVIRDNALYETTIATGAGSDTVTINGEINWNNVIALGNTTTGADTDASQKDDVNILNLNSSQVWRSAIYGSAGTDIINALGAQFAGMTVATGAGSDSVTIGAHVQDSTIALGNTATGADTDQGQKDDVNTLNIGREVARSSIYGTAGRDNITIGGDVYESTIATGAGSDKVTVGVTLESSTVALGNTTDQADTDQSQKDDVNTLVVGYDGMNSNYDTVMNSKVFGTTGTELITVHGNVNGSTIDTGTGAGDKVDIKGSVWSKTASDNNTIKAVDGSVTVTAQGANVQAVSASGPNARNAIIGNTVEISAEGTTSAYGVYGKGNASFNRITGTEKVTITATGKTGVGVLADDSSRVDITGHDVTVTGTGQAGNAASGGLRATNSAEIAIHSTGGTVRVDTSGSEAYAMNAAGKGKSLIEGAKLVLLNATHDVMSSTGGTNIVDGTAVDDDEARLNGNIGMWASGRSGGTRSLNQITNVDRVIIGSDGKTVTGAMCSAGDGTNRIDNAKYVEINATSDGMSANTWGSDANTVPAHNIIQGNGDMDVKMTATAVSGQSVARGMGTNHSSNAWANRNDILGANEVDITVSGAKKNYAMFSGGGDGNFIEAKGVDLTATGGSSENYGMFAGLSGSNVPGNANNSIKAERVEILAEGGYKANGMFATQGKNTITGTSGSESKVEITAKGGTITAGLSAETAGQNIIRDTGSVSVTADGSATSINRTQTDGVRAFLGGSNLIDNIAGDVTVLAKSSSSESITNGLLATNLGTNTISDVSGATTITATSEPGTQKFNTAVKAAYGGRNIIDVAGPVTLEASADNGDYTPYSTNIAMEASGSSGAERARNEITSAGKVTLKASGGEVTTGMSASDLGHNKITALGEGGVEITVGRPSDWYHGRIAGMEAIGDLSLNEINSRNGVAISVEGKSYQTNAMSASTFGENIIRGGEGSTVKFSVQGDTNYGATAKGMYAAYGGMNTITSLNGADGKVGLVEILARGGGTNEGMFVMDSGRNSIEDIGGDVKITAEGAGSYGMRVQPSRAMNTSGSNNISHVGGNVEITATGGANSTGMSAEDRGARNSISEVGGNVEIMAKGTNAYGMRAQGGDNSISEVDGNVKITAESTSGYAMRAEGGGSNSISKVGGDVALKSSGGMAAVYAENGANTISDVTGNVVVDVRNSYAGILSYNGGSNTITDVGGDVEVNAYGDWNSFGMAADEIYDSAVNTIANVAGAVKVNVDGGSAGGGNVVGISAMGNRGLVEISNTISNAGSVEINVVNRNTVSEAIGIQAANAAAVNTIKGITGEDGVSINATGGGGGGTTGMFAINAGRNIIGGDQPGEGVTKVSIHAEGGATGNNAMYAQSNGSNRISNVGGEVELKAEGANASYAMRAEGGGTNSILDVAGRVSITAEGAQNSYAMHAVSGGTNIIGNSLTVIIKAAAGSLGNYAMFAENNGVNKILGGDGNSYIELHGDIFARYGGQNIINTGAGDDRILLDGKVTGHLSLDAGEGYDILVLRAASWAEFTDRYQTWLTANFDTMNIESIQWALDNPAGAVPDWLQDLVHDYNTLHPSEPIDFSRAAMTDLAHIVAGDVSNIIDHDGDVSSAHMPDHTSSGHGLAAFGDGDDYVHVKGGVDHVDFTLGGGHNSLHVEGNIAGAEISGGDNGNDIRVGGSFDGALDLGSGNDRVELGALHDGIVNLGAGDDYLILNGFTGGIVDGGAGHDILTLNLGGHGGAGAFAADGAFSGLFTPGAVQNFEELHFDLSGGGDDSLVLDSLLDSLRGLTGGAETTVRIIGDAGSDHVDTQALSAGGWTSIVDPTTGDTRWTHAGSEDENLVILIQNGLN